MLKSTSWNVRCRIEINIVLNYMCMELRGLGVRNVMRACVRE